MLPISNPFYLNDPMIHIAYCPKSILLLKCQTLSILWKDLLFHNSNNRLWTHLVKGNDEMNTAWKLHVYHYCWPGVLFRTYVTAAIEEKYKIMMKSHNPPVGWQFYSKPCSCCNKHLIGWNQKNTAWMYKEVVSS